jgi:NADH dehydrogenase FAD-containing subunit
MNMTNTHRILVLGAGYAGLAAAAQLAARLRRDDRAELTLVNATENFTERMRLPQRATGQAAAALNIPALLSGTGARFVHARVTGIDVHTRTVRLDGDTPLHYDTLVYALGTVADTTSVPGATEHAHTLDGAAQPKAAHANALGGARPTGDNGPGVVVVGSGLSGIETAAEIAERNPGHTVTLVGPHVPGADLHPRARRHLHAALARLGVRHIPGTVAEVRPGAVDLADGTAVPAGLILWAAGNRVAAPPDGLRTDPRGRLRTDEFLRADGHPEIYAVGDAAAVHQRYGTLHGTCQSGMPTGVHAALQIIRALNGKPLEPFRFGYYQTPISLGRRDAVVQFTRPDGRPRRLFLTGRPAARYKEVVTAAPWPTFARMIRHPASGAWWPAGGRHTR